MKTIKFRAWDNIKNCWFKKIQIWENGTIYFKRIGKNEWFKDASIEIQYSVNLKDKKGKDIFEGDILNSLYRADGCGGVYEVQWSEIRASFFVKKHGEHQQKEVSIFPSDLQMCEVIGNIYENKELLKRWTE